MSDIKRYRFGSQPFGKWVESDEGQWVRYDDYSALEAQLQKQSTLMDMGFAEYERRLATARRDAWNRAAMVAEAWIARKENLISLPDTIRALIAQEEPKT
jgi:hypothetical protein